MGLPEHCVREDLNKRAPRAMAVLRPLKLVLTNYPEGQVEQMDVVNNPEDPAAGTRQVPFSREVWIERDDFMEDPPKKFFRLAPGREVRLRNAYLVTCTEVVKDADGAVVELRGTYDPATRGGDAPDGRRVKATLHWVSAAHARRAKCASTIACSRSRTRTRPPAGRAWTSRPCSTRSLEVLPECRLEPMLAGAEAGSRFQFERLGVLCVDPTRVPGAGLQPHGVAEGRLGPGVSARVREGACPILDIRRQLGRPLSPNVGAFQERRPGDVGVDRLSRPVLASRTTNTDSSR